MKFEWSFRKYSFNALKWVRSISKALLSRNMHCSFRAWHFYLRYIAKSAVTPKNTSRRRYSCAGNFYQKWIDSKRSSFRGLLLKARPLDDATSFSRHVPWLIPGQEFSQQTPRGAGRLKLSRRINTYVRVISDVAVPVTGRSLWINYKGRVEVRRLSTKLTYETRLVGKLEAPPASFVPRCFSSHV